MIGNELMEIKEKIEELKEKEKIDNYEVMEEIQEFCIKYPSEATEEKAFNDDYDNLNNIFYEINKFNYLNKKRDYYLNDNEKEVVEDFINCFSSDLLHIKDWNIYKNITDREHNDNDYFGEEEVEAIKETLPKKYSYVFDEIIETDNIFIDINTLDEILDSINTEEAIDYIIENRRELIEDIADDEERTVEEVEQEERKKEQWIMEEITGALRGITELKARFEV